MDIKSSEEACKHPDVVKHIQGCIDRTNSTVVSRAAHLKKFELLPLDFSVPGGELTPTMKLRRNETVKKYQKVIDQIYKTQPKM